MGNALPSSVGNNIDGVNKFVASLLPFSKEKALSATPNETDLKFDVSSCMLSCYAFTLLGVSIGLPLSIRTRNFWPAASAISCGSLADLYDGYNRRCVAQLKALQEYERRYK